MSGHEFQSFFPESGEVDMTDTTTSIDEATMAELRDLAGRYPQAVPRCCRCCTWCRASTAGSPLPASRPALTCWASHGPGLRGRDLLHDVPPASRREAPCRCLHHGAVRGDGRRHPAGAGLCEARHRAGRDHGRRHLQPRTHRVQRSLRLRPGDDGQLGVHGQHDPCQGRQSDRRPRSGQGCQLHPRREDHHRGARPSVCSRDTPTDARTRVRAPARPPCWASRSPMPTVGPHRSRRTPSEPTPLPPSSPPSGAQRSPGRWTPTPPPAATRRSARRSS